MSVVDMGSRDKTCKYQFIEIKFLLFEPFNTKHFFFFQLLDEKDYLKYQAKSLAIAEAKAGKER